MPPKTRKEQLRLMANEITFQRTSSFDCYLAALIGSDFRLPKANMDAAHARLQKWAKQEQKIDDSPWGADYADSILASENIVKLFEAVELALELDADGNAIAIDQGGDLFANHLLEPIADLLDPTSTFWFTDDEGRFWKWTIQDGRLVYSVSDPVQDAIKLFDEETRAE